MVYRVYVEKKEALANEAKALKEALGMFIAYADEESATYAAKILVRVVRCEELQGKEKAATLTDNG